MKSVRKLYVVAIMVVLVVLATACAKKEEEASFDFETAEATEVETETEAITEKAMVEAETEAVVTEAETIAEYEPEKTYSVAAMSPLLPDVDDNVAKSMPWQVAPKLGEKEHVQYFVYVPDKVPEEHRADMEDDQTYALQADVKTVCIPEWGIYRISVDPNLFPEDESKVYVIPKEDTEIIDTRDGAKEFMGITVDTPLKEIRYSKNGGNIFLDELGVSKEGCVDDSALYPGAFSRESKLGTLRMWRMNTDFDPASEEAKSMNARDLVNKLYPYAPYAMTVADDFVTLEKDGYKYIWTWCYIKNNQFVHDSMEKASSRIGGILFRLKDGVCEGIMYLAPLDDEGLLSNYVLNQTTQFGDIADVTGGKACEGYYGMK